MTPALIRRSQLAKMLGINPATVTKLVSRGVLPAQRCGTQYWVLQEVMEKLHGTNVPARPQVSSYDDWKRARASKTA